MRTITCVSTKKIVFTLYAAKISDQNINPIPMQSFVKNMDSTLVVKWYICE